MIHSVLQRRTWREGLGREPSRHVRRTPKGPQLPLWSPQTRVCKRVLTVLPKPGCARLKQSRLQGTRGHAPFPVIPWEMSVPLQLQASGRGQESAGAMGGGSSE